MTASRPWAEGPHLCSSCRPCTPSCEEASPRCSACRGHWAPESKGLPPGPLSPLPTRPAPRSASPRTRGAGAQAAGFCPHFTFPLGHCVLPDGRTHPSPLLILSPSPSCAPPGHPTPCTQCPLQDTHSFLCSLLTHFLSGLIYVLASEMTQMLMTMNDLNDPKARPPGFPEGQFLALAYPTGHYGVAWVGTSLS